MSKVNDIKSKSLPADVKRSLKLMINYLNDSEADDFETTMNNIGVTPDTNFLSHISFEDIKKIPEAKHHIYYHVMVVSEWFNKD